MNTLQAIRVMLVDNSAVVRRVLADVLRQRGFDVIAAVQDPVFALEFLKRQTPDVIVLDVEMPRMDGLTFLQQLMSSQPIPVVMCSTLTTEGAPASAKARALGAVAVVGKPELGLKEFLQNEDSGLIEAIRYASRWNKPSRVTPAAQPTQSAPSPSAPESSQDSAPASAASNKLIVIGVSTGGVQAIEQVLPRLPRNVPGIVIVQHMPAKFTATLSQRLNSLCEVEVREARNGDRVQTGVALIAPGGRHTRVVRKRGHFMIEVFDAPPVNHHRPSVDVLFNSTANCAGQNAIGVIMTGMGDDGARGMCELHRNGAVTLAQDESSSVVFGMAKEAIRLGGVSEVVPLTDIADKIVQYGNKLA